MKLFLVLCVIVVVSVNGLPTPADHVFDLESFGINAILPKKDTEEKFKCIQSGTQKLFDENTDLYWWFDEGGNIALKLIENFEKCDALTGIAKTRCLLKFQTTAVLELRRLKKLLPDDKKDVPVQLKDAVKGCLSENIVV